MDFEWDDKKALANLSKHGISFKEATTVFSDEQCLEVRDLSSTDNEERWICLGRSNQNRFLVVIFCERLEVVRIISAREATKKEKRNYVFRGIL